MNEIEDSKLANIELKKKLAKLEQAALEAQDVKAKLERYELWQTPAGSTVYRLKQDHTDGQPQHYACPVCFENAKISILQGGKTKKSCRVCDKGSRTYDFEPVKSMSMSEISRQLNK